MRAYILSYILVVIWWYEISSVPLSTFITFRSLYTEGFLNAVFQYLHIFHGLRQKVSDSTPFCPFTGLT